MRTISFLKYYIYLALAYCKYLYSYIKYRFQDYPDEIKVAIIIIAVCAIMGIVILVELGVKMRRNKKKARLTEKIRKRFGKGMEYILSAQASELMTMAQITDVFELDRSSYGKQVLKNNREKKVFTELFYHYYITIRSDNSRLENVHAMFDLFGIPEYLEKEVSLGRTKHKVNALSMMRAFKMQISPWIINKLLNSQYLRVRRLAMYSTIMSSSDSALDYFETDFFDKNCCIKDEIELAFSLQRRRKMGLKLPNLARWAHIQSNERTQCMFVRLMRRFNEVEYCGQLKDLYGQSKKKKLIEEISRTWGYLHYLDCEDLLIEALLTQPDDTKVAIMHAMTRLATGKSLGALLDGFKNTTNPHVRYEALRCLYNYGPEGRAVFHELEQNAVEADKKYFAFFNNPITLEKVRLDKEQAYHPSVETVFNG